MKKRILVLCLALCLLLTGCSTGDKKAADIPRRLTIGNVNALCQDAQLLESGKELLLSLIHIFRLSRLCGGCCAA